ncbi:unnamed protein product [Adineta steineri]|uniref:SAM domain-containing protein n=1 Tax=Adineta steineri TaxID=433720 RepID=A0A813RZD4_9BILA|nr:unnamed protein product [Adineta steineri]CAF3925198.1 unnamed protein product [Adineta steineri]
MATATHSTKPNTYDSHKHKEKVNRRPEGSSNVHRLSSNTTSSGSVPKRYQSVFIEGTPLTSFGIINDENQLRSHSPPNHTQPQSHQRPLKPVKEFLTTHPLNDQQFDNRWPSNSQRNSHTRSQTEATVQNVNAAVSKSLRKLRQEPLNTAKTTNSRSPSADSGTVPSRPTSRITSHLNNDAATASHFYYQSSGGAKGPLPPQLISKRPSTSRTSNNRISAETSPTNMRQSMTPTQNMIKSTDTGNNVHVSSPTRVPNKSPDIGLHQLDEFDFDRIPIDEHFDKFKKSRDGSSSQTTTTTRSSARKQSLAPRAPSADNQHRSLPEVSVHPHIQSSVQRNIEPVQHIHESIPNSISAEQIHPQIHENYPSTDLDTVEKYTNHHHIQVEPIGTFKRLSSPVKHQQIIDIHPNVIVQHQRPASRSDLDGNTRLSATKRALDEAYVERENTGAQLLNFQNTHTNNDNDSASTLKAYVDQQHERKTSGASPPSPATRELNRIWKKQRNKYSIRSPPTSLAIRKNTKPHRPPGRLKNYEDESDSETTATETQSREEDMVRRHGLPPSDLGSDVWSDLTSEFSDTKLRKHPNIRTSTPNITARSSSMSSKEIGQIRRQLTDLQIMYNDLLKLLDMDAESVRGSVKSTVSSHIDHNSRRHRFRKIMPALSIRHSNVDLGEVNQRFARLEASVVTLAESIAKLSAQIQAQRTVKDDVFRLRQEVGDLRQQLYQQYSRQQSAIPQPPTIASTVSATYQQPSRLISANVQRLATINSTNPSNFSTSYLPSTSTMQRSNSIIDPRQARKIEQFFGTETMLRYFLSLLNYEEYAPRLEREKIGIYELPYVSERKLQSLGIPYGPCARIIYEAQQYFISLLTLKSGGIDV